MPAEPIECPPTGQPPRAWLSISAILMLALFIRLVGITTSEVWSDEATTLMFIRASWWDLLTRMPAAKDHPPLAYLMFKAWGLLGSAEWWMRLLPVALGTLAVGVLMRTAVRIHPRAAIPTGLLAALSPVPVYYSQELRSYCLLYLLTALSWWAIERVREKPAPGRLLVFSAWAALAAHTHSVGLFVFPMCGVYLFAMSGWSGVKCLLKPAGLWCWLVLISPMVWINLVLTGAHLKDWWIPQLNAYHAKRYAEEYFGLNIVEHWQSSRLPRPWWRGFFIERVLIFAPVLLALLAFVDQRRRRAAISLAAAAVAYLAIIEAVSYLTVPSILVRTLLPLWVPILLWFGLGGAADGRALARGASRIGLGVLACVYGLGVIWYAEAGPPRRPPARQAFQWIRDRLQPHDVVVTIWAHGDLAAYYLGDRVSSDRMVGEYLPLWEGAPPARKVVAIEKDPAWPDRLRAALARADRATGGQYSVWFVAYGIAPGPQPGNIPEVLYEHHRPIREFYRDDTAGIAVAQYVPVGAGTQPAR